MKLVSFTLAALSVGSVNAFLANGNTRGLLKVSNTIKPPLKPAVTSFEPRQCSQRTPLVVRATSNDGTSPSFSFNPVAASAWAAIVAFALTLTLTRATGDADQAIINAFIANPAEPGLNEIFFAIFNLFLPAPLIVSSLVLPQGSKEGLPSWPFLLGSGAFGYFALGPYLSLRLPPVKSAADSEDMSWATKNVFENKLFSSVLLALVIFFPVAGHVFERDVADMWQGFIDLCGTSNLALISSVDLTFLHFASVALIPRDYLLRQTADTEEDALQKGKLIAAAAALFPFLGSAMYLVLRPSFTESEE